MTKKIVLFILCFLFFKSAIAQKEKDSLCFRIKLKWKTENLELNKNYYSKSDTLQLSLLKFYVSGIEINYEDGSVYKEKNSYHLIDFDDDNSKIFTISKKENKSISKLVFNIGVDSLASISGALSGDLDLQNGMYWAWQSGYINMKIEGKSNSCKTRKNAFQFHIGGYLEPNYALRKISINCKDKNQIVLEMDLSKLFEEINLSKTNSIMIPGKEAMKIADLSTIIFTIE
ncbi:MbnP family protein [Flavobacterium sp.]|uniref:MbnP family protein n=1 Tax=Flavobacterium sp. TaxID=239 RepID=UPI00261E9408|nr:MbnP family protein [Flavobacterium sp.]